MESRKGIRFDSTQFRAVTSDYYVDGNTVRRLAGYPEPYRERPAQDRNAGARTRQRTSVQVRNNRIEKSTISRPFLVLLSVCTVSVGALCLCTLGIQYSIHRHRSNIRRTENQTYELRVSNNGLLDSLSSYTNLNRIRRVAVEEYGMVYAAPTAESHDNQIESEFIYQHDEIPGE